MRKTALALTAFVCIGCPPNVQQQSGFKDAVLLPAAIERPVGDLVRFEVRPPVARGTRWLLETHGLARFAEGDPSQLQWVAESRPILVESIVAPWSPSEDPQKGRRGWLWFSVPEGTSQPLDRELPVRPLPYREIAPVTASSVFSIEKRDAPLFVARNEDRVTVTYRTPIDQGTPYAPTLGAVLLETAGKKVLYAEVKTNFGERAKEKIGYDVTLSYAASLAGPIEVVVVEWIGHGQYSGAFDVHRLTIEDPPKKPEAG